MKHFDRLLRHIHARGKPKQQSSTSNQVGSAAYAHSASDTFADNVPHAPVPSPGPLSVFAHFIVGIASSMTQAEWERDIVEAQKAHIDGFALNIAPQDDYTDRVLQTAYDAAERIGNFSLFISFDYESGGPWPSDRVIRTINMYRNRQAQYLYEGKPLVSTFEGVGNSNDWPYIKSSTGCMFIPDWTSLAPSGLHRVYDTVDGAFSWDAWPAGAQDKNMSSDSAWVNALRGKPYMMAVSPWFYTNLPQWNKNWLWRGDDLWHYRWQQVIDLQPALVQILSWNDYGESHYIGPIYDSGIPDGASRYVKGFPHDAWRAFLPHYIDSYRRRNAMLRERVSHPNAVTSYTPKYAISYVDKIVYWYRLNPSTSGSADGTTGNNHNMGQPEFKPGEISQDRVFVSVLVTEPSDVHVRIGQAAPTILSAKETGLNHFSVPFNGLLGPVRFAIVRDGREIETAVGPDITEECSDGVVNWNAFTIVNSQPSLAYRPYGQLPETLHLQYQPPTPASIPASPAPATLPTPGAKVESINPADYSQPYCNFMTNHPTIFHAVDGFAKQLESKGYEHLSERELWTLKLERGGKYYTTRNGSALIAFAVGKEYKSGNGAAIIAGHIDALTAKLKPVSKLPNKAGYAQLAVAPYAGALNKTWWDRDLSIGGRVLVRDASSGKVESRLVKLDWPIARIPTLAEHFGPPSQGPFNKETQMVPIIGVDNSDLFGSADGAADAEDGGIEQGTFPATQPSKLVKVISRELGITDYNSILNWELELYDSQPARIGGIDKDFIFAGRIDDKLCCYAAQEALIASSDDTSQASIKMVGYFDDEEIGSLLRQGARSNFMSSVIERITQSFATNYGPDLLAQTVANSFLISSDVIHAVNPNFLNVYLENHSPRLNVGVTVSADSNGHMTTDSVSTGFIRRVADRVGSKIQVFQIRNDSRSGGTIGPMTSARIGMRAIDVGIPQLSMHSIRATTGSLDPGLGVKLFKGFFDYFEEVDKEFAAF
ncbi:glycosyl hydrolase family 71-domain-containing protein [Aspergillus pseudoustus]|uniref:Glycosyl hydrolase family 71-domain-containing protein n=1 Tax=Aspergillus pseudoustus TaxID=1810923 RepID=A0ABR4JYU7_9EURO